MGTPYYIAPEILQKSGYNTKCDIWSCGIILFLMITGSPPFVGPEIEILAKVKNDEVKFHNSVWYKQSSLCKDLLDKIFQKIPMHRSNGIHVINHKWFSMFI